MPGGYFRYFVRQDIGCTAPVKPSLKAAMRVSGGQVPSAVAASARRTALGSAPVVRM